MVSNPPHILVIALSGIGNFLMQLPAIQAIKRQHPDWKITAWVAPRGTKELAEQVEEIGEVLCAPLPRLTTHFVPLLKRLRRQKYTAAIMLSPGQRIKGALTMYAAGIPKRIAHTYPLLGHTTRALLTSSLAENQNLHDIEQNLQLLPLISTAIPHEKITYSFNPNSGQKKAENFLKNHSLPSMSILVGIHAGSAPNFTWKRWPAEYFIEIGKALITTHNAHILIFGGQDENELKEKIHSQLAPHATPVTTDLVTTAALLKKCRLVVSNDSGIMHLAAAVGTPTLGLFGPTNEKNTGPRGIKSFSLRTPGTQAIYDTEKKYNLPHLTHASLLQLKPELVLRAIEKIINIPFDKKAILNFNT